MNSGFYYKLILLLILPFYVLGQGYYNQENFGNRSLLLGGNVTGSVNDLGLTYYNPARIALIENPVFSINAKAYQISSINFKNVFGRDSKISDSRFEGVPSLKSGTYNMKKWEKHHFAYAFLSKQRCSMGFNFSRVVDLEELVDVIDVNDRVVANLLLGNYE